MDDEREGLVKYELDKGRVYHQLSDEASTEQRKTKKTRLLVTLCILLTELGERLTFYSIATNLVLYGNSQLGYSEVEATTINQVFSGFVYIFPVFGGFIADAYAGRFKTILGSGLIYLAGLVLIPLSAVDFESLGWGTVEQGTKRAIFLCGLVLVAIATGGIKANVSPFGAEQVQVLGKQAVKSFFNWFYWVINIGGLIAYAGVSYIQQEISFAWGFFVPLASMLLAMITFASAKKYYIRTDPKGSVLVQMVGVCRQGCCKPVPLPNPTMDRGSETKMLAPAKQGYGGSYPNHFVDGVYSVLKVIPFCFLVIIYWAVYAQMTNTFLVQATRMDVSLGDDVNVPVGALNVFNSLSVIILIPVVDRGLYPLLERLGKPLSFLKRMGIGMVVVASSMFVAGVVEIYRKKGDFHPQELSGKFFNASSLSVFAQVPQFALVGASEIFTSITALEFAYNQAPVCMQGVLTGLFFAAWGSGNWVSSAILLIVERATKADPWWGNEINNTHMEYLLFLLGGLMIFNFCIFCVVAHFYSYQDPSTFEEAEEDNGGNTFEKSTDFNGGHVKTEHPSTKDHANPVYGSTQ